MMKISPRATPTMKRLLSCTQMGVLYCDWAVYVLSMHKNKNKILKIVDYSSKSMSRPSDNNQVREKERELGMVEVRCARSI